MFTIVCRFQERPGKFCEILRPKRWASPKIFGDGSLGEMGHVRVAFGALDVESLSARSNLLLVASMLCLR